MINLNRSINVTFEGELWNENCISNEKKLTFALWQKNDFCKRYMFINFNEKQSLLKICFETAWVFFFMFNTYIWLSVSIA